MLKNYFWIPQEDLDLHLKIIVSAHCGMMEHRGADATESVIREKFSGPLYHKILRILWTYVYTVSYQERGRRFTDLWLLYYTDQDQMMSYMSIFYT